MRKFEFTDKYIKELEDEFMIAWLDDKFYDFNITKDREERFALDFKDYLDEMRNEWLPKRATKHSCGYDFRLMEDVSINPEQRITKIGTGIRVYMNDMEHLEIQDRSSNPKKKGFFMPITGQIESDYKDEIFLLLFNYNEDCIELKKGSRIAQGIFSTFLITDDDTAKGKREGGHGSTGE